MYEFQLVGGTEVVERHFRMSEAPDLGAPLVINGKTYRRIVSIPQIDADVQNRVHGYPHVSHTLPRNVGDCEHDSRGRPIIRSRLHEKEVCAQTGRIRD
jgi:hypothetical protein